MQQMESDALQPIFFFFYKLNYVYPEIFVFVSRQNILWCGTYYGFYQFDLGQGKKWRCSRLSPNTIIPEHGNKKYSEELIIVINLTHMQLYLQSSKTVVKRALSMALGNQL